MSTITEIDAAVLHRGLYARRINGDWGHTQCGETTSLDELPSLGNGFEWVEAVLLPTEFVDQLGHELQALRRWKAEQLAVESRWASVDAAARAHPLIRIGESVSGFILKLLEARPDPS